MTGPYAIGHEHWPGLGKLAEECGEVLQVVGKIIGTGGERMYWDGQDLRERLQSELTDLMAALRFVVAMNGLDSQAMLDGANAKMALFRQWHAQDGG